MVTLRGGKGNGERLLKVRLTTGFICWWWSALRLRVSDSTPQARGSRAGLSKRDFGSWDWLRARVSLHRPEQSL